MCVSTSNVNFKKFSIVVIMSVLCHPESKQPNWKSQESSTFYQKTNASHHIIISLFDFNCNQKPFQIMDGYLPKNLRNAMGVKRWFGVPQIQFGLSLPNFQCAIKISQIHRGNSYKLHQEAMHEPNTFQVECKTLKNQVKMWYLKGIMSKL